MNDKFFAVVYSHIQPEQVKDYKIVILEPDHYSKAEIDAFHQTGVKVIAYISLGEVDPNRWYFPYLDNKRDLLGKNEQWGSFFLNLASPHVKKIILEETIENILIKGFDGLFFDTVDAVAPYTERKHLMPHMAELINTIRNKWPDIYLIQNAGLFLLDQTATSIDALLIEDVASNYNFKTQSYELEDETVLEQKIESLEKIRQKYNLPIWVVDYANSDDKREWIENALKKTQFYYFISTIELDKVPEYQ